MACSARQLVASSDGFPQEEEHGREFVGQVRGEPLRVVQRRRCVDQPTEPGGESAAGRCHPVLAQCARVAAVSQLEAGPQDRLHLAAPGTVGIIFPELLAPLEQVVETGLVQSFVGGDTAPTRRARARRRSRSPAPWRHRQPNSAGQPSRLQPTHTCFRRAGFRSARLPDGLARHAAAFARRLELLLDLAVRFRAGGLRHKGTVGPLQS